MNKNLLRHAIQQNRIKVLSQSSKPNFPSMSQMAKNLGNDLVKNIKSVASGNSLNANQTEIDKRKNICNSCEFFAKSQDRCTKCGCNMGVKTYLKASKCPIGKW
jgi:hypothetical protein